MQSGAVAASRQADGAVCPGLFLPRLDCSGGVWGWEGKEGGQRLTVGILAQLPSRLSIPI